MELFQSFLIKILEIINFTKKHCQHQTNQLDYMQQRKHKFEDLDDISVDKLKFRPTIGQTSIFTYNAAKVIGEQGFFQTFFSTVIQW